MKIKDTAHLLFAIDDAGEVVDKHLLGHLNVGFEQLGKQLRAFVYKYIIQLPSLNDLDDYYIFVYYC